MTCWLHAKSIHVSFSYDAEETEEEDEENDDLEDEGVRVTFLVAEDEGMDSIEVDTQGNDQLSPELALNVADAIKEVFTWSRSKDGQKEVARLRAKHAEMDRKAKARTRKVTKKVVQGEGP